MRRILVVAVLVASAQARAAGGYGFAGFSADGEHFLKHGADDRACTASLPPVCQPIDRKAIKDRGFTKPSRSRKLGDTTLEVTVDEGAVVLRAGGAVLGTFRPEPPAISANANVFIAPDESAVAVEYEGQGRGADVVVFPLRKAAPTPAPPKTTAAPASKTGGNAYDRAVGKGGVWEQRLVPCDQAGVHLVLKKARTFGLRVDTKCQADKNTTELSGKWTSDGADRVDLTFENEGADAEVLPCRFSVCQDEAGEDCLACAGSDVSFTLKTVRR